MMSLLFQPLICSECLDLCVLTQVQTSQTFSLLDLDSPHEQWRRENGQRYCLATMAKDTDCPGWRDEMRNKSSIILMSSAGWREARSSHAIRSGAGGKNRKPKIRGQTER